MLLLGGYTHLGQRPLIHARRPCPHLDERQRFPIVADQVDLALHLARHIISPHKNVSMPSQIPIRKRFAAYSTPPRIPSFTSPSEASPLSPRRTRHFTVAKISRKNRHSLVLARSPVCDWLDSRKYRQKPRGCLPSIGLPWDFRQRITIRCELCTSALSLFLCLSDAFFQRSQRKIRLFFINQQRR